MSGAKRAMDEFNLIWENEVSLEVNYNPKWGARGKYFPHLCKDESLAELLPVAGMTAKFTDDIERRGIIMRTHVGCLAVFQRYSRGDQNILVTNFGPEDEMIYYNPQVIDNPRYLRYLFGVRDLSTLAGRSHNYRCLVTHVETAPVLAMQYMKDILIECCAEELSQSGTPD